MNECLANRHRDIALILNCLYVHILYTLLMWKSENSLEISSDFDLTLIECSLAL